MKKIQISQAWWPGPVITTLERERQEDYELRASQCYVEPISENTKTKAPKMYEIITVSPHHPALPLCLINTSCQILEVLYNRDIYTS